MRVKILIKVNDASRERVEMVKKGSLRKAAGAGRKALDENFNRVEELKASIGRGEREILTNMLASLQNSNHAAAGKFAVDAPSLHGKPPEELTHFASFLYHAVFQHGLLPLPQSF